MDDFTLPYMGDMTPTQRQMFLSEYNSHKKNLLPAVLFALLLGNGGIHHFYFRKYWLGVIYLLFCWTFIPAIIALIEACFSGYRVRRYNEKLANSLALKVKILTNEAVPPSAPTPVGKNDD